METIDTIYKGELRTEATHLASGVMILTDAPVDNHGRGEAFSPTDILCASLGSCMATIMGIVSAKHGLNIDGTTIRITKVMAADPRRVGEVVVEFTMPHNGYSADEKRLLEDAAVNCPVDKSLHEDLQQTVRFNYSER